MLFFNIFYLIILFFMNVCVKKQSLSLLIVFLIIFYMDICFRDNRNNLVNLWNYITQYNSKIIINFECFKLRDLYIYYIVIINYPNYSICYVCNE